MAATIDIYPSARNPPPTATNGTLALVLGGDSGNRGLYCSVTGRGWIPACQPISSSSMG
jgi:hypothetical protein